MHNVCTYSCVHKPAQRHNQPHTARRNRLDVLTKPWRLSKPFYSVCGSNSVYRLRIIAALSYTPPACLLMLKTLRCILHRLSFESSFWVKLSFCCLSLKFSSNYLKMYTLWKLVEIWLIFSVSSIFTDKLIDYCYAWRILLHQAVETKIH